MGYYRISCGDIVNVMQDNASSSSFFSLLALYISPLIDFLFNPNIPIHGKPGDPPGGPRPACRRPPAAPWLGVPGGLPIPKIIFGLSVRFVLSLCYRCGQEMNQWSTLNQKWLKCSKKGQIFNFCQKSRKLKPSQKTKSRSQGGAMVGFSAR